MKKSKKSKEYVEGFKAAMNIVKYRLDFMRNMGYKEAATVTHDETMTCLLAELERIKTGERGGSIVMKGEKHGTEY